ncbi:BnaCnng75470D [Brassica napus]|uniref:(rape) hypothetical protein n=1 Tax=Brassica napus TaxID=3708 RepID=A0A078JWF8_BRANA|nr:unnamed protein product [Brassica napus]CDY71993.1 BnaCnng75470D [Brassica napus]
MRSAAIFFLVKPYFADLLFLLFMYWFVLYTLNAAALLCVVFITGFRPILSSSFYTSSRSLGMSMSWNKNLNLSTTLT